VWPQWYVFAVNVPDHETGLHAFRDTAARPAHATGQRTHSIVAAAVRVLLLSSQP
jgi:hypothetical protein